MEKILLDNAKGDALIAMERYEQLTKHKYTQDHIVNKGGELARVAAFLLTGDRNLYPKAWDIHTMGKFEAKCDKEKLVIAGALIAAEIDRLNYEEKN